MGIVLYYYKKGGKEEIMKGLKKVSAMFLSAALAVSCCFSGNPIYYAGSMLDVVTAATSSVVYNPTTGENGGFTVEANRWSNAASNAVTYNGMVLDTADKMESSTKISFNASTSGKLTLVFNEGSAGKSILIDSDSYKIPSDGVLTVSISSGSHIIKKDSGSSYLYYIELSGSVSETTTKEVVTETTTKAPVKETTTEATTKAATTTTKAQSSSSSNSSSVSWNMSNTEFKNLGTLNSDVTVNGLTIKATSAKTVNVANAPVTVGSNTFNYCLELGGGGSLTYRAVAINVNGEATIKVTAKSSGTSTRTLAVVTESGKELATISAASTAATNAVNINYSGKVYIYSTGSGINIYKVQLDSKSSTVEKTTEATTKAATTTTKAPSSSSVSWNMSNTEFKNLGTLNSDVTVNGLTIKATSAKTVNVANAPVTVGSNTFNYCLELGGGGSLTYRAVAINVNGEATIKVTAKSSGTSTRTLAVVTESGKELATISAASTAATNAVNINYSGKVYIYSTGSGINIYKVQLDSKSSTVEKTTEATTKAAATTTKKETTTETTTAKPSSGNSVTVSNFSSLVSAVADMANKSGGGTVYVNAKTIDCTAQLALKSTKGNPVKIVGVKQSDGTYPSLNFESFRNSTIGSTGSALKASGDSNVGVRISGSYYTLENLIIEKAGDNGVQIKGSSANYNTLNNCIVRYNNDAGVQITGGASYNTIRFVYSYRNCDVYSLGGNADGFAPKLGATTGNKFYGCYAWDNSDDGWDSFDKTDSGYTKDLSYEWCACWNNGNPDVFTGKYDFENGNALDKNLYLVELICKQDSSFANNYKNGKFSLPTASFINTSSGKISLSSWTGSNYDGNPNGFKFGSAYTDKNSVRTVKNCLAFAHGKKGFDNNNSTVKATFENCVSFDNGYNYYVPTFSVSKASNIVGFSGSSKDKLPSSGMSVTSPSSSTQSSIRSKVESTRKSIVSKCDSNIIPGEVYFNIY